MKAGESVTEEERKEVLEKVMAELAVKGEDKFSKVDVERLNTDKEYLRRYWVHAQLMEGPAMDNTVNLIVETFLWRKEFGVEEIKDETISKENPDTCFYKAINM